MVFLRYSFLALFLLNVGVSPSCYPRNKKYYIFEKCARIHKLSESSLETVFDMIAVDGIKYQKCFLGCIYVEYNMLRLDYSIDETRMSEAIKTAWLIPGDQELIVPRAVYCLRKGMQDRNYPGKRFQHPCEGYYELFDCFLKEIAPVKDQTVFPKYHDRCKRSLTYEESKPAENWLYKALILVAKFVISLFF